MDRIIPWKALSKVIRPYYTSPRVQVEGQLVLNVCYASIFFQNWFELSDPGTEEALYDSCAMRKFVGIGLGKDLSDHFIKNCYMNRLRTRKTFPNVFLPVGGLELMFHR